MLTKDDEGEVIYLIESYLPEGGGWPDDLKGLKPGVLRVYGRYHSYIEFYGWDKRSTCMFMHNDDIYSDRDEALAAASEKASAILEQEGREARTKARTMVWESRSPELLTMRGFYEKGDGRWILAIVGGISAIILSILYAGGLF